MLDVLHLPSATPHSDIQVFLGNSPVSGVTWDTWKKPRGKTMCSIFMVGQGGSGGTGVVGANSVSAGGGGGGSGAQLSLVMPLVMLPDILYVSTGNVNSGNGVPSWVSIDPSTTPNHVLMSANGGSAGGNAAAGVGGAAGAAGTIPTVAVMPLGWAFCDLALAGQAGIIGGANIAGAALTLPVTGLLVTGGTGGGGLPAAAAAGTNGGDFVVPAAPSPFPPLIGGRGSATATLPADSGSSGFHRAVARGLFFSYGGSGGASTHGTATGAGLKQSNGGQGAYGSGGGGVGGALTGSTVGIVGKGGNGMVIIICW